MVCTKMVIVAQLDELVHEGHGTILKLLSTTIIDEWHSKKESTRIWIHGLLSLK